jgi:hypothetical protein
VRLCGCWITCLDRSRIRIKNVRCKICRSDTIFVGLAFVAVSRTELSRSELAGSRTSGKREHFYEIHRTCLIVFPTCHLHLATTYNTWFNFALYC